MEYSGPPSALLPYTASVEPTNQSLAGHRLTPLQLDELAKFPSPTIANAIETFQVRGRLEGVTDGRIRCLFPALGPVVGYACTAGSGTQILNNAYARDSESVQIFPVSAT